jgi:hypothetical protein
MTYIHLSNIRVSHAPTWRSRLVGAVAAALPPGVVTVFGHTWLREHPAITVLLLSIYGAFLMASLFVRGIYQEVAKGLERSLAAGMEGRIRRSFTQFPRRLRGLMRERARWHDGDGGRAGGLIIPIDTLFIHNRLDERNPDTVGENIIFPPIDVPGQGYALESPDELWDLHRRHSPSPLIVVGAAGSGKTALWKWLVHLLCENPARKLLRVALRARAQGENWPRAWALRAPMRAVVLVLDSRQLALCYKRGLDALPSQNLTSLVRACIPAELAATEPPKWLESKLLQRGCAVIMDGLDDIGDREFRKGVLTMVDNARESYPGNFFLLLGRPYAFEDHQLDGRIFLEIATFKDDQIKEYIRRWFQTTADIRSSGPGVQVRGNRGSVDDLIDWVTTDPVLRDFGSNPLLLSATCQFYESSPDPVEFMRSGELCGKFGRGWTAASLTPWPTSCARSTETRYPRRWPNNG